MSGPYLLLGCFGVCVRGHTPAWRCVSLRRVELTLMALALLQRVQPYAPLSTPGLAFYPSSMSLSPSSLSPLLAATPLPFFLFLYMGTE